VAFKFRVVREDNHDDRGYKQLIDVPEDLASSIFVVKHKTTLEITAVNFS
jgi:hypothetical protein